MWYLKACRGCLATEGALEAIDPATARAFSLVAGIEISDAHGYPSCLCLECKAAVKRAAQFRRKARRAHYTVKEIVHVRGQATLQDIESVDKVKTNLKSNLCITQREYIDIEPVLSEEDKLRREKEIAEAVEEIKQDATPIDDDDEFWDDNIARGDPNDVQEVDLGDIDLEDVFKGLREPSGSELDSPEEESEVEVEVKKKTPTVHKRYKPGRYRYERKLKKDAAYFAAAKIKYLNEEKQKAEFQRQMQCATFVNSRFKCTICVKVFPHQVALVDHCEYHNKRKGYTHLCTICRNLFPDEESLLIHGMEEHWYEISCPVCHQKHYTFSSLIYCQDMFNDVKSTTKKIKQAILTPLTPQEMYSLTGRGGNTKYKCTLCDAQFNHWATFKSHKNSHESEYDPKKFYCDICGTRTDDKRRMTFHMQKYHLYKYTCQFCKTINYDKFSAWRHFEQCRVRKKSNGDVCIYCGVFLSKSSMSAHVRQKHAVHCCLCGVTHLHLRALYQHQLHEHGHIRLNTTAELNDLRYYCIHCKVYFCDEKAYFTHLCHTHREEAEDYENGCVRCFKLFNSAEEKASAAHKCVPVKEEKPDLEDVPEKKDPSQIRRRKCEYCNEELGMNRYTQHCLDAHPEAGPGLRESDVICELCGKIYHHMSLKAHMKTHEDEQDKLKCKFCVIKARSTPFMIQHILASHTYKPYMCQKCPKRFENRHECRDHLLKSHAPVLPYHCEACSRRFAHLDFLNEHCIKVHNLNLKKTDRSVFLPHRKLEKIYIYPHMKIDGTHVPKELLPEVPIYTCDYMEENWEPIDYKDCFFFDPDVDPNVPTKMKQPTAGQNITKDYLRRRKTRVRSQIMKHIKEDNVAGLASCLQRHGLDTVETVLPAHPNNSVAQFDPPSPVLKDMLAKALNETVKIKDPKEKPKRKRLKTKIAANEMKNIKVYDMPVLSDKKIKEQLIKAEKVEPHRDMPDLSELSDPFDIKGAVGTPENFEAETFEDFKVGKTKMDKIKVDKMDMDEAEIDKMEPDTVEMDNETEMENVTGDLVEYNGVNYVLIDGLMYKLESTENGFVIAGDAE